MIQNPQYITPSAEEDARSILRWMLDPTFPPFGPELEQAACRCASLIVRMAKEQRGETREDDESEAP